MKTHFSTKGLQEKSNHIVVCSEPPNSQSSQQQFECNKWSGFPLLDSQN